ncbi:hypothetical protein Cadr_000029629 [Camelus dromedarius]|uniref:Uncharacterized protein n=1 Tax=Camelus dromedarius TaxID=9838 RepID=A0A5N4CAG9_CAMDR|nr:hypothetical protein Cadr_000029629 [Camelus dromedarius]
MKFLFLILVLQAAAFGAAALPCSTSPGENDVVFAQRYPGIFSRWEELQCSKQRNPDEAASIMCLTQELIGTHILLMAELDPSPMLTDLELVLEEACPLMRLKFGLNTAKAHICLLLLSMAISNIHQLLRSPLHYVGLDRFCLSTDNICDIQSLYGDSQTHLVTYITSLHYGTSHVWPQFDY